MEFVQSGQALAELRRELEKAEWVALDTEFVRERTYYARLCLIQLATPQWLVLVDPLALDDLSDLLDALYLPRLTKVLHAARQDLEVFYDLRQDVPRPVFDTQLAAAYLGYDDQIGYGALVQALTGVTLEKTQTRTDWAVRPLSAEQLRYAQDDVRYLRQLYGALAGELEARGRLAWLAEDCARLADAGLYRNDPETAWRRLKSGRRLAPAGQRMLRALAAWREQSAREKNLPRGWIVRDDVLLELARRAPETRAQLAQVSGLEAPALKKWGDALLACVAAGRQAAPETLWPPHTPLTPAQTGLCKRVLEELKTVAREQDLSAALLGTRHDVEELVRGAHETRLLRGWRGALLGERLAALLAQTG